MKVGYLEDLAVARTNRNRTRCRLQQARALWLHLKAQGVMFWTIKGASLTAMALQVQNAMRTIADESPQGTARYAITSCVNNMISYARAVIITIVHNTRCTSALMKSSNMLALSQTSTCFDVDTANS